MRSASFVRVCVPSLFLSLIGPPALAVTIRDAPGGQNNGYYLDPTASVIRATFDGGAANNVATGIFDSEADFGGGFEPLLAYCIDPLAGVGFGQHPGDPVGLAGYNPIPIRDLPNISNAEATLIEILWTNAFIDSQIGPNAGIKAAAFQALLWEMFLDDGVSVGGLGAGLMQLGLGDETTELVRARAVDFIGLLQGGTWNDGVDLLVLDHPEAQDFLVPIPEPASIALLSLAGATMLRRRPA